MLYIFYNMSSTRLIDANFINSDIIDVNQKLSLSNIDIVDLININFNDLSGNIYDLSLIYQETKFKKNLIYQEI